MSKIVNKGGAADIYWLRREVALPGLAGQPEEVSSLHLFLSMTLDLPGNCYQQHLRIWQTYWRFTGIHTSYIRDVYVNCEHNKNKSCLPLCSCGKLRARNYDRLHPPYLPYLPNLPTALWRDWVSTFSHFLASCTPSLSGGGAHLHLLVDKISKAWTAMAASLPQQKETYLHTFAPNWRLRTELYSIGMQCLQAALPFVLSCPLFPDSYQYLTLMHTLINWSRLM